MDNNERKNLEKILRNKKNRLQVLKEKAAQFGADVPAHIVTEIQELEQDINSDQKQLAEEIPHDTILDGSSPGSFIAHGQSYSQSPQAFSPRTIRIITASVVIVIVLFIAIFVLSSVKNLVTAAQPTSTAQPALAIQTIALELPEPTPVIANAQDLARITIKSVSLKYPNIIKAQGRVENLPSDTKLWIYVFSGDRAYHFRAIDVTYSTWKSSEVQIGALSIDSNTYDYRVGIIQAHHTCPIREDTEIPEGELPDCVKQLIIFPITRSNS
ncbi:MAG: hypothetical protein IPP13_21850 [Kouleothrix sp.]|jgi:hypothetical protein|nr:hypothetical protein [Kouleothrix sp.]